MTRRGLAVLPIDRIYNQDCMEGLKSLPSQSINLTVTSPPYDNLRTYNGFSFDFEGIAKELYRVTKQGGVVVWIVGDATVGGSETGTSFRQALFFKEIGFRLHDTMIYQKANPLPQNHRRYEQAFEYAFVLSKGAPATFNPILEPCKLAGKSNTGTCRRADGTLVQKYGSGKPVKETKVRGNIWSYGVNKSTSGGKHPAAFPMRLVTDHVISWSNEGDLVLDCFIGSGTTAVACKNTNRHFIGFELSQEYCAIADGRLAEAFDRLL